MIKVEDIVFPTFYYALIALLILNDEHDEQKLEIMNAKRHNANFVVSIFLHQKFFCSSDIYIIIIC